MASEEQALCADAICKYGLSERGAYNFCFRDVWGAREKLSSNPWTATNPTGLISLRMAENSIMHQEVVEFVRQNQLEVTPADHLTYSTGPRGSMRLRRAVASYLEDEFCSTTPITADDIFITPGLTSGIDAVIWSICNEGEGVLIPKPFYNGFKVDITARSSARIVEVSYDDLDGYTSLDDLFSWSLNRKALERAFEGAKEQGIKVRALAISHPHNPLGRCYTPETIAGMMSFCNAHQIHFISDEIYAKSEFENPAIPDASSFTSSLALKWTELIDSSRLHVLYGASKDFCLNGLRIGVVYTQNKGILSAMTSISPFSWAPHIVQDIWAAMLEDKGWTRQFLQKNSRLMAENYKTITTFLERQGISFYHMNAGLYVWVDLRPYLFPTSERDTADYSHLRSSSQHSGSPYAARESKLAEVCIAHGVQISPGTIYGSHEYGWYRITFTSSPAALKVGLTRLLHALQDPVVSSWS